MTVPEFSTRSPVNRPPSIVPVKADQLPDIRGKRAIIGDIAHGWLGDLRADSPISQGQKVFVPVLPEHDWYRSEAEAIEVFAALIPLDRVWIEVIGGDLRDTDEAPDIRPPMRLQRGIRITGRRVIHVRDDGTFERNLRGVSEFRLTESGRYVVLVAHEAKWYYWARSGFMPRTMQIPIDQLWLE